MDNEFLDIANNKLLQLGYGVGHILNDVSASLWFTYLLVFFHLVLEFSASQAGTLMLIGQVVDALSTPFVGYHCDHTEGKTYGKRKLWHLFGTACVLGSFPFIFSICIGCSMTHKWAQMFYYVAFIMIFQIGWAAVQISHLSLIPELSSSEDTRAKLGAIRFAFTVISNLFVFLVTWAVLHFTGECDKHQIGPEDEWKFRHIVYIVLSVGACASIVFHVTVKERLSAPARQETGGDAGAVSAHGAFLRRPVMYQVAAVYMCSRLVTNVSQVLLPLYVHRSLGLAARALALVPLAMCVGSMSAAVLLSVASGPRKVTHAVGSGCCLAAFVAVLYGAGESYNDYYVYAVAVLIGFGSSALLVTSLALTADLVGAATGAAAFVYGLMSFTDKLSCGLAIALVQKYADGAADTYYRDALSWLCGGATVAGLCAALLLPPLAPPSSAREDATTGNPYLPIEEPTSVQ